jgi:hypothetical protein
MAHPEAVSVKAWKNLVLARQGSTKAQSFLFRFALGHFWQGRRFEIDMIFMADIDD